MAATGGASGFGIVGKLFGNAVSSAVGFGAGVALAPVLSPAVRDISNSVNSQYSFVFPEPGTLANGVAQGQIDHPTAGRWASYWGVGDKAFQALVDIANTGPGVPAAFDLWRRDKIDEPGFRRAAKRQGLEAEWIDALVKIKQDVLDQGQLAAAIHRGLIPDPGLLKGTQPSGQGNVEAYPVYQIDAIKEAEANGYDRDHLGVLVGLQGLPMGSHEAAQAQFRGVLTEDDYLRAIAEGNTRNEWADAIREQSRQIPSVTNYVEAFVRGWITEAEMNAGAARHGMTPEDTHTEFLIHGRPLSWHQVFIGMRRGGTYDGPTAGIDAPFLKALRESNIRPEWYNIAWAQRFTYPAAFVLRALVQGGDLTAAEGEQILLFEGWEPTLAKKVTAKWAQGSSAAAKEATASDVLTLYDSGHITQAEAHTELVALGYDAAEATKKIEVLDARRVSSAKTAAIGDMHGDFKKGRLDAPAVEKGLAALGLEPWAVAAVVDAWRAYRIAEAAQPPPTPPAPVA